MVNQWFFGEYLQRLLDERGLDYKQIADRTGLSATYVSNLLQGRSTGAESLHPKISVDTLISLSKGLNINEYRLLLAYKGIDPDKHETVEQREDLVVSASLEQLSQEYGVSFKALPYDKQGELKQYFIKSIYKVLRFLMEREVQHLKVIQD